MTDKKNENAPDAEAGLHWHSFDLDEVLTRLEAPKEGLSTNSTCG